LFVMDIKYFLSSILVSLTLAQNQIHFVGTWCENGNHAWVGIGLSNIAGPKPMIYLPIDGNGTLPCLNNSSPLPLRAFDPQSSQLALLYDNGIMLSLSLNISSSDYSVFKPPPPPNGATWVNFVLVNINTLIGLVMIKTSDSFCQPHCLAVATQELPTGQVAVGPALPYQSASATSNYDIVSNNLIVQLSGALTSSSCGGSNPSTVCVATIDVNTGEVLSVNPVETPLLTLSQRGQGNFTINGVANGIDGALCYGRPGCFSSAANNYQFVRTVLATGNQEQGFCLCNKEKATFTFGSFDGASQRFVASGFDWFNQSLVTVWNLEEGTEACTVRFNRLGLPSLVIIGLQFG